eukprot:CAMPEP_0198340070 /NCGR_PEP_ID=MMETSP1450-20131203/42192_1 /TAXON_ID=753684 ORGANISM="Madagascaria erythrocladiodes, Strain CCMP3234" /NCGR_SAMPLE_ID=MMETSP1450 /ASSEMBLY_ACC=CAM_ASM_001115 /LENGTH=70 /DNA_ID=CAMNT_0044045033 /DNA_START=72 /DNA_END=280 /DNA_ORIENTATION=+
MAAFCGVPLPLSGYFERSPLVHRVASRAATVGARRCWPLRMCADKQQPTPTPTQEEVRELISSEDVGKRA